MRVFITGITGTLGRELLQKFLLHTTHDVVGYSRDEQKQRTLPTHPRLTTYLGDVRDRDRLIEATRGVDLIFHLAALKCVDTLEANPEESIRTNIEGTQNVLHAQRLHKIPRVVLSSTDKAVYPINVYGMSKAVAEKLVLRNPNNIVCRYGNVLGSRGSVVPMFVKSLLERKEVNITDAKMTRFWMSVADAAEFVFFMGQNSKDGGIKIPPVQSSAVIDLAALIAELLEVTDYKVVDAGIRPGEKIHECLRAAHEGQEIFSNDIGQMFSRSHLKSKLRKLVEETRCAL